MSKIYFILTHLGRVGCKWLGPAKTISHLTSYLTYLLRYDALSHPHVNPMGTCRALVCPKYINIFYFNPLSL